MDGSAPLCVLPETVIRIVLMGEPISLGRNRHRYVQPKGKPGFVQTYMPAQSRDYQAVLRDSAVQAMEGRAPLEGPIDLRFACYMTIPRSWSQRKQRMAIYPTSRPDFDNLLKQVDAFKAIVWRDDTQVTDVSFWKRYSDNPRIVIEVRPILGLNP